MISQNDTTNMMELVHRQSLTQLKSLSILKKLGAAGKRHVIAISSIFFFHNQGKRTSNKNNQAFTSKASREVKSTFHKKQRRKRTFFQRICRCRLCFTSSNFTNDRRSSLSQLHFSLSGFTVNFAG